MVVRRNRGPIKCVGIGLLALAAGVQAVQLPNQTPPVFRSGAYLVYVDAYPRHDGRVVEGLAATDFIVSEDGKPQKVEIFEFVGGPNAAAPDNPSGLAPATPLQTPGRLFVLYFNRYFLTMEGARRSPEPLVAFLRQVIGPRDLVSWHTPDLPLGGLTFGQPLDRIEEALRQSWRGIYDESPYPDGSMPVAQSPQELRLAECYISRTPRSEVNKAIVKELLIRSRIELVLKSLEELIGRARRLKAARMCLPGAWRCRGKGPHNTRGDQRSRS
jgi:hypothetical protein